jgi:excisionase family DNA binding protein
VSERNGRAGAEGQEVAAIRPLDGPLLTPAEAAALLSVKTSWIYEAVRTGRLPCLRLGRHIRFTRAMLEEWLDIR